MSSVHKRHDIGYKPGYRRIDFNCTIFIRSKAFSDYVDLFIKDNRTNVSRETN